MRLSTIILLLSTIPSPLHIYAFPSPNISSRNTVASSTISETPFAFTYLFTAHLSLGPPSTPIPIPGGVRVTESILNGTVTGPAINATISYSLATPSIINNGTLQRAIINAVGTTDDGVSFYLYETGVGSVQAQTTRIEIEISGGAKYSALRNGYILASVHAAADRESVDVMGYLVET